MYKSIMERDEFSKFLTDIYSHGALMSAIGLGHDLGLFTVFYDTETPQSLQEIATKLNLKERLVDVHIENFRISN